MASDDALTQSLRTLPSGDMFEAMDAADQEHSVGAPSDAVVSSSKKVDDGSSSKKTTGTSAEEKATAASMTNHLSASGTVRKDREKKAAPEQSMEAKLAATKRKLREGYERCADAKRRRRLQVIEAAVALTCCTEFDLCE